MATNTVRVSLTFDVSKEEYAKLIPSVSVYAEIWTAEGVVLVENESHNAVITATGTDFKDEHNA